MIAETLLSRLDGVRRTRQDAWMALCPSHPDKRASLSVRELDNGQILVHCFAGCSVEEVLDAAGLIFDDLFPESQQQHEHQRPVRCAFSATDALRAVSFEATLASIAASDMARGKHLSEEEKQRLLTAAGRISTALEVVR